VQVIEERTDNYQHRDLGHHADEDLHDLADEVSRVRQRSPVEPLERSLVSLGRDGDPEVLEAGGHDAARDHAGHVELADGDASRGSGLPAEDGPEHHQQDGGQREDQDDCLPLAEKRLQLDLAPRETGAQHGRQRSGDGARRRPVGGRAGGHLRSPMSSR
jgi:hypothetical protein